MAASNISGSGRGHRLASDDPSPSDHSGDEATVVCRLCLVRSRRISRRMSHPAVLTIISASYHCEFSRRISGAGARAFLGGTSCPLYGRALVRRKVRQLLYIAEMFAEIAVRCPSLHRIFAEITARFSTHTQDTQAGSRASRHKHQAQEAPRHAQGARSRRDRDEIGPTRRK